MASRIKNRLSSLIARQPGRAYSSHGDGLKELGSKMELVKSAFRQEIGGATNSLKTDDGVIPLPDEEELERVRRRKAARRSGGRASTVLSEDNRLGG